MATTHPTGTDDTIKDRLVALLDEWMAAIVTNDAARIADYMTDDWIMVSENGITPAARFLTLVETGALSHSAMQRTSDAATFEYRGNVAVLTVRATNTAHFQGKRFDADEWTTDVFVETEQGWRCSLTHITAVSTG
ncbi:nuclear transport factor 2 family protein [Nocardia colli]|uniref:Nuclear transport factor 2 family protein n=1 Tax=Nocardia colli TaxID=2545717 RepID=A0A5N0EAD3_9NOCA|nr:nuclear transport factor 2 family protein [Nocardia colli]KAA8885134.1 nuclear transport factor 2 family protein [Nocardia colli]